MKKADSKRIKNLYKKTKEADKKFFNDPAQNKVNKYIGAHPIQIMIIWNLGIFLIGVGVGTLF